MHMLYLHGALRLAFKAVRQLADCPLSLDSVNYFHAGAVWLRSSSLSFDALLLLTVKTFKYIRNLAFSNNKTREARVLRRPSYSKN